MRDVTHPVADAPANSAQTNPGARAAHVLVAEDDGPLRAVIATWLSAAGYRVSGVADGEAAWDALCADTVDVLITDHDMPGLTGLELLRRVRAGPLRLPVILISGRMPWSAIDLHALLPPGLALEKPFTLPDLRAHVDALLAPPPRVAGGSRRAGAV
jgi:DNA-binding response OmpR family regulator